LRSAGNRNIKIKITSNTSFWWMEGRMANNISTEKPKPEMMYQEN
jgi:hypothetical protein